MEPGVVGTRRRADVYLVVDANDPGGDVGPEAAVGTPGRDAELLGVTDLDELFLAQIGMEITP
jgi:hypothetical protein